MRFSFFLLLLLLLAACGAERTREANAVIEQVALRYAPDRRIARFNIIATPAPNGAVTLQGETTLPEAKAQLLLQLDSAGIRVEDYVQVLPDRERLNDQVYGLAKVSPANIRSEPRHSAEMATQAVLGTPLRVFEKKDNWLLVQTPDGYLGWINAGEIRLLTETELDTWQTSDRVFFDADFGYVFETVSGRTPHPILVDLLPGSILEKRPGDVGDFAKVRCPDGREGFVPQSDLLTMDEWRKSRRLDTAAIFTTARRLLGRPYMWGGTSAKAMDCSGYTKTIFRLHGLLLPRDASQQVHTGIDVVTDSTLQNVRPGDLLFFGRPDDGTQPEKITHVGLYLGNGQMAHAGASNGSTRIESLRPGEPGFDPERLASLVRARRLLNAPGENGAQWLWELPIYGFPK